MPEGIVTALAVGALVLALLALLSTLVLALRVWRIGGRRGRAVTDNPDLDRTLADARRRVEQLGREQAALAEQLRRLETEGRRALARVGVVRFNPFEDTGGNQSFALAVLDSDSNGIVVSSLHSRQGTRVYLKAIAAGRSEAQLSDEETEALRRAGLGASGN